MAKKYAEKLKDPRWQKKRLEIMGRDEFMCQGCQDTTSMLSVHHRYYVKGREPWDYPDNLLVTLCQVCHEHERDIAEWGDFDKVIRAAGVFENDVIMVVGAIHTFFARSKYPPDVACAALNYALQLDGFVEEKYITDLKANGG
jgi:hypothetical protein